MNSSADVMLSQDSGAAFKRELVSRANGSGGTVALPLG